MKQKFTSLYTLFILGLVAGLYACTELGEIPFVALNADFKPTQLLVRTNEEIIFQQKSSLVAKSFQWDFGDANSSTEETPAHSYDTTGLFQVRLVSTKEDGVSTDTMYQTIHVIPPTDTVTNQLAVGDAVNDEAGYGITVLADGFLVVGRKNLNVLLFGKTDFNGNVLWQKEINNLTTGLINIKEVEETGDGGFVVVGFFQYNETENDSFIIKINSDGEEEWRFVNSTARDEKYTSVIDFGNTILVSGTVASTVGTTTLTPKIILDEFSSTGVKTDTEEDGSNWEAEKIEFSSDGGFALAATEGGRPMFLKYDIDFDNRVKITLPFNGKGFSVTETSDGDFVLVGEMYTEDADSTHAFISRIDATRGVLWTDTLEYYKEGFYDVIETEKEELIAIGVHQNPLSNKDVFFARYSKDGILEKVRLVGGIRDDEAFRLTLVESEGVESLLILGSTQSFDNGQRDFYLFQLTTSLK